MYQSTVTYLQNLASLKLSFVGMAALLAGVLLSYFDQNKSVLWIALPLLVLAINLLAAIVYNPRIRQNSGLLMFHICLLALAVLAALGQLTSMKGRVEIVQGQSFNSEQMTIVKQGPWHSIASLQKISFEQGDIVVEYTSGLRRGKTKSQLLADNGTMVVGDNIGFKDAGYRFYTTSNKGYAAMLAWHGEDGQRIHGAIHFPSFPLYDWKQENQWITPTGQSLNMTFIGSKQHDPANSWQLDNRMANGSLHIEQTNGVQQTLTAGQRMQLDGGELEFAAVHLWMGYSIFYNPWLAWFFAAAIVGVLGLAWHFYLKLGAVNRHQPCTKQSARSGRAVPTA